MLLIALFALPMIASFAAYRYARPEATGNYGELLLPPTPITAHAFARPDGTAFAFSELRGKWVLVASDSGACPGDCAEKLTAIRQVRLALGRNASRVARVFVVDDRRSPDPAVLAGVEGSEVALAPAVPPLPPGAANDRAHIYLVDPRGEVMMRWPARPEPRRMLKDLERLLRASQIG
jgi:cytochrome oxidase Cu insertion factor (SCO1/SenC/PrrC family)